jgi:uncharacterized protein
MTIKNILNTTAHRPWTLPSDDWSYYQEWNDALFLHWQVQEEELRKWLPKGLELDLWEGKPWVSLVAFSMEKIRLRYLPAFPPISNFFEVNIRTYVQFKGRPGVYFLSLEGGTKISCQLAKGISGLPYRYSTMKRQPEKYLSENNTFTDRLALRYRIGEAIIQKTKLDKWLTERYAAFHDGPQSIWAFDTHHVEWPTQHLTLSEVQIDYPRFQTLINNQPDLVHYSPGVQVLTWSKKVHPIP